MLPVVRLRTDADSPEDVTEEADEGERHEDVEELASDTLAEGELADRPLTTGYRMLLRLGSAGVCTGGVCTSSARLLACSRSAASRASRVRVAELVSDTEDVSVASLTPGLAWGREAVVSRLEQHVPDMGVFRTCT